ncbi:MAG TPA: DinB family protein [Flavilitoribacter sp.]|nr:DinB family protein [Flavilitoribacter sp.]HMQ90368.1 DinB family protein [Flavilitoribacter sp.]
MFLKSYLIDTFRFNDRMNRQMLAKIAQLPAPGAAVRQFSHLINSQNKWLARILQDPDAPAMSWWDPVYPIGELAERWHKSLQTWLDFLDEKTDREIGEEVEFTGYDGTRWTAALSDIALQLNYHSIHHRAQMQVDIRNQGLEPDFIDYIGTKYRRVADTPANEKILELAAKFEEIRSGTPWYGDNFQKIAANVTPARALEPGHSNNSIIQMVWHMIYWRKPLIERLKGNLEFRGRIEDPDNWHKDHSFTETDWPAVLNAFDQQHAELMALLRAKDDAYLTTRYRDGKNMAWFIEGVLQHDIYHLGQIAAIGLKV